MEFDPSAKALRYCVQLDSRSGFVYATADSSWLASARWRRNDKVLDSFPAFE